MKTQLRLFEMLSLEEGKHTSAQHKDFSIPPHRLVYRDRLFTERDSAQLQDEFRRTLIMLHCNFAGMIILF